MANKAVEDMLSALEKYTYDFLLSYALSQTRDDIDKREGSVIYDTLAPFCYNLAVIYSNLVEMVDSIYPDTAIGGWLDKNVENFGMERYAATGSTILISAYSSEGELMDVPIGSKFSSGTTVFTTTERRSLGKFVATTEQTGMVTNVSGNLIPVDNIDKLGRVTVDEIIIYGQDEESDDDLRTRFYDHVRQRAFGGNVADYKQKTVEIDGVGQVDVFPIWNGPGTVKLVISNELGRGASEELVQKVQETFGETDKGNGLAPIGHLVTVSTSTDKVVNVTATLTIVEGASLENIKEEVEAKVEEYINGISFFDTMVYWSRLNAAMLNVEGMLDVVDLKINGSSENLQLSKTAQLYEVPKVGTITLS